MTPTHDWTGNPGLEEPRATAVETFKTRVMPRAEIPTQLPSHLPNITPEEKTVTNDIHQEYDPQESIHPGMRARHALDEVLEDIAFLPEDLEADFPEDDEVHRLAPSPEPLLAGDARQWDPEACIHMRHHLAVLSGSVRSKLPEPELRALRQAMRPVGKAGPQTP